VLQYFAVIFVVITLVAGFFGYRVVKDRDGAPDPLTPWSARRSNLARMWARVTLNPDIAWHGPTVVGR
jgi:hypothetical protein